MRTLGCLALLACGRVGFDATLDGNAGDDAVDSASSACTATLIPFTLAASGPVSDIVATTLPGGYALGFLHAGGSVLNGVVLDSELVPNTLNPFRTSPAVGTNVTYSHASLFWDGTTLDGSTTVIEDGYCYFKTFQQDMSSFIVADGRMNCFTGEPSVGLAGTTVIGAYHAAGAHTYSPLNGTGMPTGDVSAGTSTGNILSTSIASGTNYAAMITSTDTPACDLRSLPYAGASGVTSVGCANPRIATGTGVDEYIIVYEAASGVVMRTVSFAGTSFTLLAPIAMGAGTLPQLFTSGAKRLLAYRTTAGTLGIRLTPDAQDLSISGLPASGFDAFETAGPYVFATFGAALYAVRCP